MNPTDTTRPRTNEAIRLAAAAEVARGLTPLRAEAFFRGLVSGLADCLEADFVFCCEAFERDGEPHARTVAQHPEGSLTGGLEYPLSGTPCGLVFRASGASGWGEDVSRSFPDDELLSSKGIEAYVGVPLRARDGNAIGHLVALYRSPQPDLVDTMAVLDIFAMHAASELERQRLLSTAERAAALVERSLNEIYILDGETFEFVDANRSARENLGYSLDELRSMTPADMADERAPSPGERLAPLMRGEVETLRFESVNRRRDGSCYPIELAVHRFDFGGRRMFAGIGLDITERRKLETQLLHSQKLEAVGSLAGGVAHDFNNLLTAILGNVALMYATLAEEPVESRSKTLAGRLAEIERASDRATSLTRQLLTFSRKDVAKLEVLDLNRIVAGMELMLQRLIGEHITLELDLDPETPAIWADRGQIEQVVMNLALNARDAMADGGRLRIGTSAEELAGSPGRGARLTVRDTGTGMDEYVQRRIFEPFFTTKPVGEGTGLGLSTTYGIVKSIGGEIELESELGSGTTFQVRIPATEKPRREPPVSSGAEDHRRGEVVLVCEDDEPVRYVTSEVLRSHGYEVLEASGARQAEQIATEDERPIDLLITDIVMPDMNGHELARRLASREPEMRVLLMSGYSPPVLDSHGIGRGELEFLQKPFAQSALLERVRRILDGSLDRP